MSVRALSFLTADSIRELAVKLGIDPDTLAMTLDEYNAFCEGGHDPLFATIGSISGP
jgi:hypothetical protein